MTVKNNDIIVTTTGAIGIYQDGEIHTPDGDPLFPGCEAFALRMIPGDPDTLDIAFSTEHDSLTFPETRAGSTGLTVALLQAALWSRGFYQIKIDGIFGSATNEALRRYRKQIGLSGDTVADMEVYKKLFKEQEKSKK